MDVPVTLRSNEVKQLTGVCDAVAERLCRAEQDDAAETVLSVRDARAEPYDGDEAVLTVYAEQDAWTTLLTNMDRVYDELGTKRTQYFQRKITRRLRERLEDLQ